MSQSLKQLLSLYLLWWKSKDQIYITTGLYSINLLDSNKLYLKGRNFGRFAHPPNSMQFGGINFAGSGKFLYLAGSPKQKFFKFLKKIEIQYLNEEKGNSSYTFIN